MSRTFDFAPDARKADMATTQIDPKILEIAEWIAAHPRCTRGEIVEGLGLTKRVDSPSISTVFRRLNAAVEKGLVTRTGATSASVYEATDALRIDRLRRHLAEDVSKRARVGYHAEWLDDYEPNRSSYLRPIDLARLEARCPRGSAPLSKLNDHDVSMFMCDLSYASSRLEGNEYDYASTIQLAEHHIEKNGGSFRDKVMILNHRDAARFIIDSIRNGDEGFGVTGHVIRSVHAILSADLLKDSRLCGNLRSSRVEIGYSSYIPPDIPDQIDAQFERITRKAAAIENPYEQAMFLSVHLPYLQPFEDCNKRTARVVCNIPLLVGGVTPISWMDVTTRPRDYADAMIAVYEHNDTLLLSEVFVDCFLRSTERFSLLQRQKNPDPVSAKYRQEVKQTIRARVLEGAEAISPNVAVADLPEFSDYVERELAQLVQNEMLGVRYGLTPNIIRLWAASTTGEAQRERMRA
jgi:Fic family protein/predicted transcriptional regulator